MLEMLVIADDLSGAADCGIACAGHGLTTMVVLGDELSNPQSDSGTHVLSIDADTRSLPPEQAAARTANLLNRYLGNQQPMLFKKLDSMLRGNIAHEIAACLEASRAISTDTDRIVAVLAPAFPAYGRTTVKGRQHLHGKPLEETGHWQNERVLARSHLPEILREANLQPELLDLDLIRSGLVPLQQAMKTFAQNADVLVCDAETDQDLRAIADASMALGRGTLWAGSAGLAYHLPPAAGLARASAVSEHRPLANGPTLFVIGSHSATSRQQAEILAQSTDAIALEIPPAVLLAGQASADWPRYASALKEALSEGREAIVSIGTDPEVDPKNGPMLSAALAQMVRPLAEKVGALVATGGETARAVLNAWGVTRLRLIREVETGLPYAITEGWRRQLPVLTKAGSFGSPQTLLACQRFLCELDRNPAAAIDPAATMNRGKAVRS